ncbi:c-type cytochrome [Robertkochia solimangrovi]|uniref:c-type cytochrome n=1 Tax=Robertkochia solimangrovi TaxID=2213046 RepID=UPI00117E417F|nr:c-type cytochrome [Robertkochia solimangrovi]TRZ43210.1 hypothetical protein DMZ48_11005 [Robertkochia solimangrovi]
MKRLIRIFSLLWLVLGVLFYSNSCSGEKEKTVAQIEASVFFNPGTNIPLEDAKFQVTETRISRGDYLANHVLKCFRCHSDAWKSKPGDSLFEARKGVGRRMFETDSTRLFSMNITADTLTGIGGYTDAEIANAIRKGVGRDGRVLADMPTIGFSQLTDEDLVSLVVYIRTLKPIVKEIPKRKLPEEMEMALKFDPFNSITDNPIDEPDMNDPLQRGKYLAGLAVCAGCHTPFEGGKPKLYAGGSTFEDFDKIIYGSNISSDSSGIGTWTEKDFIAVIRTGKGGTLSPVMPWRFYKDMTDEDLSAIFLALKSTNPVDHVVLKGFEPSYCQLCNMEHGMGSSNATEVIVPVSDRIAEDLSGRYKSLLNQDEILIQKQDGKFIASVFGGTTELIPIADDYFYGEGLYAPIRFLRNTENIITGLELNSLLNNPYEKVAEEEMVELQ